MSVMRIASGMLDSSGLPRDALAHGPRPWNCRGISRGLKTALQFRPQPHEFVYTKFVKNVTISLPDGVLEKLRDRAAAEKKSLNQWLRELLSKETEEDDGWSRTLLELSDEISANQGPRVWNREDAYADRLR